MLAQLAGAFQAPLVKLAGLLQALPRNFAYGLKALIDQRGGPVAASPAETPTTETAPEPEPEPAAEAPADATADTTVEPAPDQESQEEE